MAKVVVINHVTLDGVMQAPARPDEDTRDGFAHGGWGAAGGADPLLATKIGERMGEDHSFLFGRRTYEDFYAVWPKRTDSPFSAALTDTRKYVASRTVTEPLPWSNSVLVPGDAAPAVAGLKQEQAGTLVIFGSGELIASLMAGGLIDEYLLMVHPIVLGSGRRMFAAGQQARLRLTDAVTTPTGVVIAGYVPGGD
jgi:dihydrofolate reductase